MQKSRDGGRQACCTTRTKRNNPAKAVEEIFTGSVPGEDIRKGAALINAKLSSHTAFLFEVSAAA